MTGETIHPAIRDGKTAIYEIKGLHEHPVRRLIVTSAPSRELINSPEITGCDFTDRLGLVTERALSLLPRYIDLDGLTDRSAHIFNLLRGGLNFGSLNALKRAYDFKNTSASFMTSERRRTAEGRWEIAEDQYQKFSIPQDATIFCGDITATGSTIANGFSRLTMLAKNTGISIRRIIFFTIGCHKAEKILADVDKFCRSAFKGYSETIVIYIEGKFHLADSKTDVSIKIQGTDLLRHPALLPPEFLLSQFETFSPSLERCVIYDGGTRSFSVPEYLEDVTGYWRKVLDLAESGVNLDEYIEERLSTDSWTLSISEFVDLFEKRYPGLDLNTIEELYIAGKQFRKNFLSGATTLQDLCMERLGALQLPLAAIL